MSRPRGTSGPHLSIPRKSTEIEDPGAHELSSDDEFQDAPDGRKRISRPVTPTSPIPITRVERVDDEPRHGEVPGTPAYDKRRQDAVPDEIEIVPEGRLSKRNSRQFLDTPLTPGGTPIPRTVVEKLDDSPSYGDEPGTPAYKKRMADAIPDILLKNPDPSKGSRFHSDSGHARSPSNASIPETIVTRADDELAHGEVPGTAAAELRKRDATPDKIEIERDVSDDRIDDDNEFNDMNDNAAADGFGDDFDDFEEGANTGADEDFGDFDDFAEGEQPQSEELASPPQPISQPQPQQPTITFPLLDFDALSDLPDLLETTKIHLDAMFPSTTTQSESTFTSDSIPSDATIFPTDRSRSLWTQLITPPPLQPPNWTQSRIRRLFLISLGVPVDLDEILPPSKQKKLILPDITLPSRTSLANDDASGARPENDSIAKLRTSKANDSTASVDSQQSAGKSRGRERPKSMKPGQLAPAPGLDLSAVKRICATTEEKLDGFTGDELQSHVKELETLTEQTSLVLEYWLKRRDGLRKEKEAFEGVIENLVRHAKRVRTIK